MRLHKEFYTIVKKHIKPCVKVKVECEYHKNGSERITFWVKDDNLSILGLSIVTKCQTKTYKQCILEAAEECITDWKNKNETTKSKT